MDGRTQYLRPSGAATWSKCAGYAKLCAVVHAALLDDIETDVEVREDGTACHWLVVEEWEGRHVPAGSLSPNSRVITDEMHEATAMYHEVIGGWAGVVPVLEKKVPVSQMVWGCQDGTPDAFAFDPTTYTLYVADFKFGYVFVEVWKNLQLTLYVGGIIKLLDLDMSRLRVVLTICQPRSFHPDGPVRTWETTAAELEPLWEFLRLRAMASTGPDPLCTVNSGCTNCPARHACQAYQSAALQAMQLAGASTAHNLTPWQLGNELRVLEEAQSRLEGRIEGLRIEAERMERHQSGVIPHYAMMAHTGRERYRDGAEAVVLNLAPFFKVNAAKETRAKTPAQLRKLGMPKHILEMYVERPSLGYKLRRIGETEIEKKFSQHKVIDNGSE